MYGALVVNLRAEHADVVVDRRSRWGNPWKMVGGWTREMVVMRYGWAIATGELGFGVEEIREHLSGQRLGCWCAPALCHAHVLACVANEPDGLVRVERWLDGKYGFRVLQHSKVSAP